MISCPDHAPMPLTAVAFGDDSQPQAFGLNPSVATRKVAGRLRSGASEAYRMASPCAVPQAVPVGR
jgi:hypothetical protein